MYYVIHQINPIPILALHVQDNIITNNIICSILEGSNEICFLVASA